MPTRQVRVTAAYVAACLSMLGAGTVYLFSIYGPAFKTELHFSALQTSLVASAGDYGLYLSGPLWGFLVDRYGPRLPALLGGGLLLAGYSLLARLFQTASWSSAVIPPTLGTVALASLGFTLVGLGSQSAYMASMATTARNFSSQHRGVALGLPIGLFGLSAFFFSQINRLLFTPPDSPPSTTEPDEGAPSHFSPTQFLWFMALATSGAHFVAFLCLRIVPPATSTPAALITEAETETETETRPPGRPEAVPMASESTTLLRRSLEPHAGEQQQRPSDAVLAGDGGLCPEPHYTTTTTSSSSRGPRGELNPPSKRSFFRDPQALYLVLGMLGIAGTGLMYINNSGTLIDTLLPDQPAAAMKLRTRTVSLLSLCNFLARVVSGQLSDTLLRRFAVPRIALLFLAGVIMTVAQVGAAHLTSISGLDALTVAIGVAYGAVFALSPTVTSEYWGTEHLGYHWGWIVLGPAIGGHVGNSIFGLVYDAHVSGPSNREGTAPLVPSPPTPDLGGGDVMKCIGNSCFHQTFMITAAICAFSSLMYFILLLYRVRVLKRGY
ncbi:hypothetical protein H4R33_005776 [Dimargaris cristalligena]|nr:hypothetical protein H4R33_005776 [Dimargaris cristalligena]